MRKFAIVLLISAMLLGCASQTQNQVEKNPGLPRHLTALTGQTNPSGAINSTPIPQLNFTRPPIQHPTYDFSLSRNNESKLIVYYFYSSYDCGICDSYRPLLRSIKLEFGNRTEWREFDLQNESQGLVYWSFADYKNLTNCLRKVPAVYFNNTLLIGYAINGSLENAVNRSLPRMD